VNSETDILIHSPITRHIILNDSFVFTFGMKRVFYGAAIQGAMERKERSSVHEFLIKTIQENGYDVYTEHTTGKTYEEAIQKLQQAIGPLPQDEHQRKIYVRNKMIEAIEGNIIAAIFEVSTPSLGTGIEIAHSYLRPRIGLSAVPVLALYEKDYWPNKLSTMIQGISTETVPHFTIKEYSALEDAKKIIHDFFISFQ
jgi:predicted RNase H-like HicB family nuclease